MHIMLDIITYYITLTNLNIYMHMDIYMPMHRSITRINRNENKNTVINVCCGILLFYIILSIILSRAGLNEITIFCIIIFTASSSTCIIYCCIKQSERETEMVLEEEIPTIIAYPIPDNHEPSTLVEAVVCEPEFSA